MSRSNTHSVWLRGRLRRWLIGATVVALAAWLFEFSTHIHLAEEADDVGSSSVAHLCVYCAAMQMGAGPVSTVLHIAPATRGHLEAPEDQSFSASRPTAFYRSRAPPVV
jgi:hypothetical protein